VAGSPDLAADVEAIRREVLASKAGGAAVRGDVAGMRERIFAAKAPDGDWEAKIGPGRLQDLELLAQTVTLMAADPARRVEVQLRAGLRAGLLSKEEEAALQSGFRFLWRLQAGGRLLSDRPLDMAALGEGGRAFLLRETGTADLDGLRTRLTDTVATVAAIVGRHLPLPGG
jgi:glutamate-ammonia-ligase adenylyltransferase